MLDVQVLAWCGYTGVVVLRPDESNAKFFKMPLGMVYLFIVGSVR